MPKVLIAPVTLAHSHGPHLRILRDAGLSVVFPAQTRQLTEEDLLRELPGVSAVMAGSESYTRKVLDAAPELRVIARSGVGYDAVDVTAATERGIAVTITPGANNDAVAEHAFAMLLALAKRVLPQDRAVRTGKWKREPTLPLRGRTLGVVGLGRIGKTVALRGAAFKMRLLAYETFPDPEFVARHGIELVSMDRLFAESDYVTLHVPLTPDTRQLVNRRTLGLMKPTAFLVNTARGGLACEADLCDALRAGRLAGAALDVFEVEPCLKNALFELDNVVLTPHVAGVDEQSRIDMAVQAAEAIASLSRGQWPAEQIVNPEARPRFKW